MKPPVAARLAACIVALLVLGGVFMAYAQPSLMVQLSEQLWACF